jgi:hypothetical protein
MRGLSIRVRFKGLAPDTILPCRMLWAAETVDIDAPEEELAEEVV